ncbi:MAG TPA: hypothetical protein VI233_15995, partial [Puia sp.]
KEIWTIHSIETKNYIAEFFTHDRLDAYEVEGQEGGITHARNSLKRIDSIRLYSMADFKKGSSIPIKTVAFTYDYSLCPSLPASKGGTGENGKLTLKQLTFRYDKSAKETQSYYSFHYNNENDTDYRYNESALDRWGNYKKITSDTQFNTIRYPYSEQDTSIANKTAQAWHLNRITLPTGGAIDIRYEAKDYAYVQDKPAMQMFKIKGFLNGSAIDNNLYGSAPSKTLVVDLGKSITSADLKRYYKPGERLYVNCILSAGARTPIDREQISGFFDVTSVDLVGSTAPTCIKITLSDPKNFNPIAHALWQKMRKNLTQILFEPVLDADRNTIDNVMSVVKAIPKSITEIIQFFNGYESKMMTDQRGKLLDTKFGSFVRLYNPAGNKVGGGSRVRQIMLYDNWDKMTNGAMDAAVYGQEYIYQKKINGGKETISSGVASYEPLGNEENPLIVATGDFNTANVLAPDLYYYKTEPFGESFFPSPAVGYSQVTVRDLHDSKVTSNSSGFETYEYYTAQDFPVITNRTAKQGRPIQNINPFNPQQKFTASQGFYVEINDMHGKLKAHKIYSALNTSTPMSGIEYIYKTSNGLLDNTVPTIHSATGKITGSNQVGIDYDFNIATAESRSLLKSPALQINVDVIPAVLGIPFPVPSFLPFYSESLLQYRGVTTTKLLYRTGIIDSAISYDNGIQTSTKNILYDESSGQTVVTATRNEYNTRHFTTRLPAHWFQESMGPVVNANKILYNFKTTDADNEPILHEGDQLLLESRGQIQKGWIYQNAANKKFVIDEQGTLLNNTFTSARIIHSGLKNMQGLSGGEIITQKNPTLSGSLAFDDVIDASAIEYNQYWQTYYAVHPEMPKDSCLCRVADFNLNGYKLKFNNDGTLRAPTSAVINSTVITDSTGNCKKITIELDKGI